ncbi:UNVERIFIED_ORG: hypothetical protein J2740_004201 [Rhizobium nepotum]|nr:hypothetical protein [Rhizobium nepotum]
MLHPTDTPDCVPAIRRAAQDQAIQTGESDKPFSLKAYILDR